MADMKRVAVLGSTGSIGTSTLEVIARHPGRLRLVGISAHSRIEILQRQIASHRPEVAAVVEEQGAETLRRIAGRRVEVLQGAEGLVRLATHPAVDVVVVGTTGPEALVPLIRAIEAGKQIALASKELLVMAGELIMRLVHRHKTRLIPVDSEHSAVDQCLRAGQRGEVRRLILTASGGPFLNTPADQFDKITPEQALKHPVWKMGRRITVDSATLMNKGLEVIEARWLFDIPAEKVDVMVHPQSIVHSMVEFVDGSVIAQLGTADMRQPIQYALTYPERLESAVAPLDWTTVPRLDFSPPDRMKFPCVGLAYAAIQAGGTAPAVVNAADEVAVEAFLKQRIAFSDIPKLIAAALEDHTPARADSLDSVIQADAWARAHVATHVHRVRMSVTSQVQVD